MTPGQVGAVNTGCVGGQQYESPMSFEDAAKKFIGEQSRMLLELGRGMLTFTPLYKELATTVERGEVVPYQLLTQVDALGWELALLHLTIAGGMAGFCGGLSVHYRQPK